MSAPRAGRAQLLRLAARLSGDEAGEDYGAPVTEGKPIESGTAYSLGLEIADGKARSVESGAEVKQIEGVPHAGGGVFLFVHSDPLVVFSTLVIEGVPDMDALRDAWVARKLAALGL